MDPDAPTASTNEFCASQRPCNTGVGDVVLSGAKVQAEIGEILAGQNVATIPREGRVVFKTVGMAIEDLTAARLVWEARGSNSH